MNRKIITILSLVSLIGYGAHAAEKSVNWPIIESSVNDRELVSYELLNQLSASVRKAKESFCNIPVIAQLMEEFEISVVVSKAGKLTNRSLNVIIKSYEDDCKKYYNDQGCAAVFVQLFTEIKQAINGTPVEPAYSNLGDSALGSSSISLGSFMDSTKVEKLLRETRKNLRSVNDKKEQVVSVIKATPASFGQSLKTFILAHKKPLALLLVALAAGVYNKTEVMNWFKQTFLVWMRQQILTMRFGLK